MMFPSIPLSVRFWLGWAARYVLVGDFGVGVEAAAVLWLTRAVAHLRLISLVEGSCQACICPNLPLFQLLQLPHQLCA